MEANNRILIILLAFAVVVIEVNATPVEQIKREHDHINAQAVAKRTLFWPEFEDEKVVGTDVPKKSDVVLHNLQKRSLSDGLRRRERPEGAPAKRWTNFFNFLRRKSKNRKSMVDPPARFSPILLRRQPTANIGGKLLIFDPVTDNPNRYGISPDRFKNMKVDEYIAAHRAAESGAGSFSQQEDYSVSHSGQDGTSGIEEDLSRLKLDDSSDSDQESRVNLRRMRHKQSFKTSRKLPTIDEHTRL